MGNKWIYILVAIAALIFTASAGASEASELAARDGITQELAEHDLAEQRAHPEMMTALQAKLGGCYGGVYFAPKTGYWMVPLPSCASKTAAKEVTGTAWAKFPLAKHTYSELESHVRTLEQQLARWTGKFTLAPEAKGSTVVVSYLASLTKLEREELKAAATLPVTFKAIKALPQSQGCAFPYCSSMEGGEEWDTYMSTSGAKGEPIFHHEHFNYCSAGFIVTDSQGYPAMLTAQHCLPGPLGPNNWDMTFEYAMGNDNCALGADNCAPPPCPMTPEAGRGFEQGQSTADWELFRLGCEPEGHRVVSWGEPPASYNVPGPQNASCIAGIDCKPKAVEQAYPGQLVCHSGATSGTHCGEVDRIDENVFVGANSESHRVEHLAEACMWNMPGDSGGAWFAMGSNGGARAVATLTGSTTSSCTAGKFAYGYEIQQTLAESGTRF